MTIHIPHLRPALWLSVAFLAWAAGSAGAAELKPGEYACAGSGGRVLIGLGFKLSADGSYTDVDGKDAGRATFSGSNVTFSGGHLNGYVGTNVRCGTNFEIHSISCSHN